MRESITPERWQRVKHVFSAASALPEAERRSFLDDACHGEPELLAEIESLLDAHRTEDAIIDRPAVVQFTGDLLPPEADLLIGRRIGAYEIVALIAHGGMGDVYRARRVDAEYEKEVAIKLVSGGFHAAFVLQRLRAERQILANLEHPNIARLIDGGATDEGWPFLVLELVDGEPLDQFAAERGLSVRERLQLFRNICAAVTYAHQHLVVHRDLKPSNVLVTGDGTVKLLDFGIAKLLQPEAPEAGPPPTRTIMQVLTPGFASPEQILGRPITTASDVYSLGVVLYVLLTGRSPYRSTLDTAEDAIRAICDTEPVRPSAAVSSALVGRGEQLGPDLDAIILQALRKEPERRYASVEHFSEDIRRHLDGLPVLARGDRLGYRAGKFLRRHKFEMAAAGLLAATLIGATVVSVREARIAAEQKQRAERHFASVRGLANAFLFRVHDTIKDLPGSIEARELLVSTALEYLNTLAAEAGTDQELGLELAAAYQKVGDIQGGPNQASLGQSRAALDSYAKSIALLEPVIAADPGNARALTLRAENLRRQSHLLLYVDEIGKAADASARAVAEFESLAEARPDIVTRRALAAAYSRHSQILHIVVGTPAATTLSYARRAVDVLEDLIRQDPQNRELARELAFAYSMMAAALVGPEPRPNDVDEALSFNRKAFAIDERLLVATGGNSNLYVRALLFDRIAITDLLHESGDHQAALENARAAQKLLLSLKVDAKNTQAKLDGALVMNRMGISLLAVGSVGEAATIFEQNLDAIEKLARDSDLPTEWVQAETEQGLGAVHSSLASQTGSDRATRLRHWNAAQGWYEKAIPRFGRGMPIDTVNHVSRRPYDDAVAGLARSRAEIAKLTAVSPPS